jgi:DNA-directed RNA polymerase II subunit RPB9
MSRGLKFCPETNDLLYPRENKQKRQLEYYCKNCPYVEVATAQDQCVYVSETKHDAKEQTIVLQDVTADPTLPRTQEVTCPTCAHNEAVFFSASSEQVTGAGTHLGPGMRRDRAHADVGTGRMLITIWF